MEIPNNIRFNGHDLSEILYIRKFNKGIRLGRTANYSSRNSRKGVKYEGYTSDVVTFTMDFLFKPEVKNKKERLAKILNVTEPQELKNSSEPGIVYYAFPVSNIESDETSIFGGGTITWEIPDGVSHSIVEYEASNDNPAGDPHSYIIFRNPGTEPMELDLEVEFRSESGFVGIESDNNSRVLFGDMGDIDGEVKEFSDTLFDDHMATSNGWTLNNGKVPPVTSNPRQQGTMGYRTDSPGEGYAYPTSHGTVVETDWHGPSITKTVPQGADGTYPKNWDCRWRADFNTVGAGTAGPFQVGHQSMTFIDQNDQIICSVVLEDNNPTGAKSDMAIYVGNKRVWQRKNTNDYYVTARPGSGYHIWVERWHKLIQVHVKMGANAKDNIDPITGKQYPTQVYDFYTDTETQELRKITFYSARYRSYPQMTNNLLRAVNVVKHNVNRWVDIPNKFKDGDVLFYGRENSRTVLTVNGISQLKLRDPGSSASLVAPPGQSIFYIGKSNFALMPKVKLKGRARYVI